MLMVPMWQLANIALGAALTRLLVFDTVVVDTEVFADKSSWTPQIALKISISDRSSSSKLGSNGTSILVLGLMLSDIFGVVACSV